MTDFFQWLDKTYGMSFDTWMSDAKFYAKLTDEVDRVLEEHSNEISHEHACDCVRESLEDIHAREAM